MKTRAVTYIMEIYTSNNTMTSAHCDYDVLGRRIEARSFADSPAAMLTEYGVVERYEYDAYGRRSVMTPGFAHRNNSHYLSDIGLTGREIDELDLDATATPRLQHMHYRHRDYNPQLGRFLQHDPLDYIDSLSLYEYVNSMPINVFDPLGLKGNRWPCVSMQCEWRLTRVQIFLYNEYGKWSDPEWYWHRTKLLSLMVRIPGVIELLFPDLVDDIMPDMDVYYGTKTQRRRVDRYCKVMLREWCRPIDSGTGFPMGDWRSTSNTKWDEPVLCGAHVDERSLMYIRVGESGTPIRYPSGDNRRRLPG